ADEPTPVWLSFTGSPRAGWDCWFIESGGEGPAAALPAPGPRAAQPAPAALAALLERGFGARAFRPGQVEPLAALLEGRDAAALLPTGGGKSLIFQLAALLRPGTAVV